MIEVEVEGREGAGENSNLKTKQKGNESLTTDIVDIGCDVRVNGCSPEGKLR